MTNEVPRANALTDNQRAAIEFALGACAGHRAGEAHVASLESLLTASTCSPQSPSELTAAARDVLAERRRQVEQEGWTPEGDDSYEVGELAKVAACYAMYGKHHTDRLPPNWPEWWDTKWWKPGGLVGYRRNLEKAGALILAEIERLDRVTARGGEPQ